MRKGLRRLYSSHDEFMHTWHNIESIVSRKHIEERSEQVIREIPQKTKGQTTCIAWSAGKDSLVLEPLCRRAGISNRGVFSISDGLEYPEMERYYATHTPEGMTTLRVRDWPWMVANAHMLFPKDKAGWSLWGSGTRSLIHGEARRQKATMILFGRRTADNNFCGPKESNVYMADGIYRYNPIRDWSQEEVLAFLHYNDIELPPSYYYFNGFFDGSGCWPALIVPSIQEGWKRIYKTDPTILPVACQYFSSAREYMESRNHEE